LTAGAKLRYDVGTHVMCNCKSRVNRGRTFLPGTVVSLWPNKTTPYQVRLDPPFQSELADMLCDNENWILSDEDLAREEKEREEHLQRRREEERRAAEEFEQKAREEQKAWCRTGAKSVTAVSEMELESESFAGTHMVKVFRISPVVSDAYEFTLTGSKESVTGSKQIKAGDLVFQSHTPATSRIDDMTDIEIVQARVFTIPSRSVNTEGRTLHRLQGDWYKGFGWEYGKFGENEEALHLTIKAKHLEITDRYTVQLKGGAFEGFKFEGSESKAMILQLRCPVTPLPQSLGMGSDTTKAEDYNIFGAKRACPSIDAQPAKRLRA